MVSQQTQTAMHHTFSVELAGQRLSFSTKNVHFETRDEILDLLRLEEFKQSDVYKYPIEFDETEAAWKKRVAAAKEAEDKAILLRKADESAEQYRQRIVDTNKARYADADNYTIVLRILSQVFKWPVLELKDLKKERVSEVRTFLFNVLNLCDLGQVAGDFFPKTPIDIKQNNPDDEGLI